VKPEQLVSQPYWYKHITFFNIWWWDSFINQVLILTLPFLVHVWVCVRIGIPGAGISLRTDLDSALSGYRL